MCSVGGGCSSCEFLSESDLRNKTALYIPYFYVADTVRNTAIFYEHLTITQNGSLVKWIFTADDLGMGRTGYPELRIYRETKRSYIRELPGSSATSTLHSNVYEVIIEPPVPVHVGDVISLELPPISTARLLLTFVLTESPPGIDLDTSDDIAGIPLITLEIGMPKQHYKVNSTFIIILYAVPAAVQSTIYSAVALTPTPSYSTDGDTSILLTTQMSPTITDHRSRPTPSQTESSESTGKYKMYI